MSSETRKTIAYWFFLTLGIILLLMQAWKYYQGTLELSLEELIVCAVSSTMLVNPIAIADMFKRIVTTKYGKRDDA